MGLTLSSKAHRLTEMKPTPGWTDRDWTEKVIVLDLEDAETTLAAVEDLRLRGVRAPLVIVGGSTSTWRSIGGLYPDVVFLELPLNAAALNAAVDRAAQLTQSDALAVSAAAHVTLPAAPSEPPPMPIEPAVPDAPEEPSAGPPALATGAAPGVASPNGLDPSDDVALPSPRTDKASSPGADAASRKAKAPAHAPQPQRRRKPRPAETRVTKSLRDVHATPPGTANEAAPDLAAAPAVEPAAQSPQSGQPRVPAVSVAEEPQPTVPPSSPNAVHREPAAPGATGEPVVRAASRPQTLDPMGLVRGLKAEINHLPQLVDLADVLREQCHSASRADASTLLLPDGEVWRVEAANGLRPLEERLQIESSHWLVEKVGRNGDAILIQNTDVARNQLSGSPLASWPNLMAVPVPEVQGVVLLARRAGPFTRSELERTAAEVETLASALRDALDVRELARQLIAYTDPV
ncbi:MAG: hypothetical protein QOE01_172 [Actinomycetota bacterium]|nr:hypothetical protein [Actinomycetota bacterium]